jgi:predicted transcriptional regulator
LDPDVAEALDLLAKGMRLTREQAAAQVIRDYLTSLGALDHWPLEADMETVGNA